MKMPHSTAKKNMSTRKVVSIVPEEMDSSRLMTNNFIK